MPPMAAAHLTQKVVADHAGVDENAKSRRLPWRPINQTISIAREPPKPATLDEKQQRSKRDVLASSGNQRYDEWRAKQPPPEPATPSSKVASVHFPVFRERHKHKEIAGEWASADQVLRETDRVDRAVAASNAAFLQNPPYPKQGGGTKNVEFSYMSAGYDYRSREQSKEISGTWPIMRTRAITESARINETVATQRPRDTQGGGRWTIDQRYGNPPTFTPGPSGDAFRQSVPRKWIGPQSPPHTAPNRRIAEANKWRGGFKTDFPPRSSTAEPLDGATPWLHHTMAFEDRFHDMVAVHIPESIRHGNPAYRPNRVRGQELTGNDMTRQFWPQHTFEGARLGDVYTASGKKRLADRDDFLPNPSQSCTWNTTAPPSPLPSRHYPKSIHGSPRGYFEAGADLVSASQIDATAINTTSNTNSG